MTTLAALRLTYIAVREANRFLGTQAILTMLAPPLGLGLLGIGTFFIVAFGHVDISPRAANPDPSRILWAVAGRQYVDSTYT